MRWWLASCLISSFLVVFCDPVCNPEIFDQIHFQYKHLIVQVYLQLVQEYQLVPADETALYKLFREELIKTLESKTQEQYCKLCSDIVMATVLLNLFLLKAVRAEGPIDPLVEGRVSIN